MVRFQLRGSFIACTLALFALVHSAAAATLSVAVLDPTAPISDLQSGFQAFQPPASDFASASGNQHTYFTSSAGPGGLTLSQNYSLGAQTVTATFAISGTNTKYGAGNVGGTTTDTQSTSGSAFDNLAEHAFWGREFVTLSLSGLSAGPYTLSTFDRGQAGNSIANSAIAYSFSGAATGNVPSGTFTEIGPTAAPGFFTTAGPAGTPTLTLNFTADGVHPVVLMMDASQLTGIQPTAVDNAYLNGFTLTAVTPEPGSMLLLSLGVVGLGWLSLRARGRKVASTQA
jgi:hypothetical protein